MLPTQDEIVARLNERRDGDPLGFEIGEYIPYLDHAHAKPFLKPECTESEWEKDRPALTREAILKVMFDYMEFAWDKANNCRGISANRSIMHYIAWTWLAGDKDFSREIEGATYEFYGKNILTRICQHYEWNSKLWDNGRRANNEEEDEAVRDQESRGNG